jgi:prepilin peptidase CpaA
MVWAAAAAAYDLRTKKIPNWLTFPAILLGLSLNVALGGALGLRDSLLGMATGVALLFAPFALGGMGAGDVKMLAAVGAFTNPSFVFRTFLYGSVAGGLIALAVIVLRPKAGAKQAFPYGIAILAGVVAASVVR